LKRRSALLLGAAAVALVVLALVGHEAAGVVPRFADWVEGLGAVGMLVFVLGYAVATVLLVPGSLLTLAAGAVFGLGRGVAIVLAGATIGASAAFLIGRYAARGAIERRMGGGAAPAGDAAAPGEPAPPTAGADGAAGRPASGSGGGFAGLVGAINEAAGQRGLLVVLLLRLSPILPFNILNYLLGLSRVRFRDFVLGSIGMLPGTLLYVYYGRLVGDLAAVAAGVAPPRGTGYWAVLGLGLVATVAVSVLLARMAKRILRERIALDPPPPAKAGASAAPGAPVEAAEPSDAAPLTGPAAQPPKGRHS
jgi:uncharacterized membrane protein YdjX (TVP38/TMEM64 family)